MLPMEAYLLKKFLWHIIILNLGGGVVAASPWSWKSFQDNFFIPTHPFRWYTFCTGVQWQHVALSKHLQFICACRLEILDLIQ